jgi:PPE-repeat protein
MAAAVQPYMTWLNTTAAAAEQAASQAMASAAAYQAAFAMTVPPPVIAANRAQLAALVATNFLGQNTPAIAANEAHYGEMWAQDATAMYGYAGSSASAGTLQPLTSPTSNTNPAGLAAAATQATGTQTGLSQLVSGLPNAMQTLASPLADSTLPATPGLLSNFINSTQNVGLFNAIQTYSTYGVNAAIWHIFAGAASAIAIATEGGAIPGGPILADAAAPAASAVPAASPGLGATPVLASVGQSAPVGGLSVPPAWSAATPAAAESATLASTGGSGWAPVTEEGSSMTTVPAGMPAVASAGRGGFGFGAPRYGFKPTVMHRPVMVG